MNKESVYFIEIFILVQQVVEPDFLKNIPVHFTHLSSADVRDVSEDSLV
jgi:hypothetical protein